MFLSGSRYVRLNSHVDFQALGNDERTISFWVFTRRGDGSDKYLVGQNAGINKQWHITVSDSNGSSELKFGKINLTFPSGKWNHVVFTVGKDSGLENAYLNGIAVSFAAKQDFSNEVFHSDVLIGRNDSSMDSDDAQFIGGIDELRFYRRGFTAEVKALYDMELSNTSDLNPSLGLDTGNTHNLESTNFVRARSTSDLNKYSPLNTKLVTHREFQKLYPAHRIAVPRKMQNHSALSASFIKSQTDDGKAEEGGFYRVGNSQGVPLGAKKEDVAVWNTRCVLQPIDSSKWIIITDTETYKTKSR